MAARPGHRHAALRQPQDQGRRRLHRMAGCGHRRAQACACRAGAGRDGLPGGARRRGGVRLRHNGHLGLSAAQGGNRPDRRRLFRCADRTARRARHHRHQRKDLDGLVAGPGLVQPGAAGHSLRADRHAGHRPAATCRVRRTHDARPGAAAAPVPPLPGRRRQGMCDRSLVGGHRRTATGRHADSRGGLHQFHPGPPGLSRNDGGLLASQGRTVPLAGPAGSRHQPGRREGAGSFRSRCKAARSTCGRSPAWNRRG